MKLKLQFFGHQMPRTDSLEKTLMLEKIEVGSHHQLDRHEFEQALGVGEGQGNLVCCGPWGGKESDSFGQLNNNNNRLNSKK